eukprot:Awhi_evm2s1025
MMLNEKGREHQFGDLDGRNWTFTNTSEKTMESYPIRQVKYQNVIQTERRFFKIVPDPEKSTHLNCHDALTYEDVESVNECALKTTKDRCFVEHGIDYTGNQTGQELPNVYHADDCNALCLADSDCRFWTYSPTPNTCLKKATTFGKVKNNATISGKSCDKFDFGYAYTGSDIGNVTNVYSAGACQYLCSDDKYCNFWSYDKSFLTCFKKKNRQERIPDSNVISAGNIDQSGFMFNPLTRTCVTQTCSNGIYGTKTSSAGWVSYIATGYYPAHLKSFNLLPFNGRGRFGCATGEENTATINGVVSLEACVVAANTREEPVINFKVSTGSCELLSCELEDYAWKNTDDTDIYVAAKSWIQNKGKQFLSSFLF